MKRVAVVDYGLGNLRSVTRGLERAGADVRLTSDPEEVLAADRVVLPGVGAFHEGMAQLRPLVESIQQAVGSIPVLGICLGMQMLLESSEEHGRHQGLGLVPGEVCAFPRVPGYKVPHMGWNTIRVEQPDDPLLDGLPLETHVYFVHSYYARTGPAERLCTTDYICSFSSVVRSKNAWGVQFHPEKSSSVGLRILENFIGRC
ncbi:MAG TPA: imidazole glycerol phosphate synthase subunit HisH [Methanoregulaceae archaeon]|jgi:glutamine amidotransferase|nr:imidazole glycerol phosphate synthase subunit HisH [Methanoregulaceae archaeon]